MIKEVISKEQATKEVHDFLDHMDIDVTRKDEASQGHVDRIVDLMVKEVMAGHVTFTEDHEPVVKPWRTKDMKPLTIAEPTGANLMASGTEKSAYRAMLMEVAEMTGTSVQTLSKLKSLEVKTLQMFHTLFTA